MSLCGGLKPSNPAQKPLSPKWAHKKQGWICNLANKLVFRLSYVHTNVTLTQRSCLITRLQKGLERIHTVETKSPTYSIAQFPSRLPFMCRKLYIRKIDIILAPTRPMADQHGSNLRSTQHPDPGSSKHEMYCRVPNYLQGE